MATTEFKPRRLNTREEIEDAIYSSEPQALVGLNGRGLVTLQLPAGFDYITLSADQARGLAELLKKHAANAKA